MTKIDINAIKELRERTGSGMSDCKKALEETSGNIEEAIDFLRKKGLASAAKKSGRITADGVISVVSNDKNAVLLEVNSETDFVAKNDKFINFVKKVSDIALNKVNTLEELLASEYENGSTVQQTLSEYISIIGENLTIRRFNKVNIENSVVGKYIHNKIASQDSLGKIGVVVVLDGTPTKDEKVPYKIAMHISAMKPISLSAETLDPEVLEREKQIQKDLIMQSGKPAEVAEKMMEGRLRKFYEASCLLNQSFIMDDNKTIADILKENGVSVKEFHYFVLGEGIEKKEEDFAAEVAKITS